MEEKYNIMRLDLFQITKKLRELFFFQKKYFYFKNFLELFHCYILLLFRIIYFLSSKEYIYFFLSFLIIRDKQLINYVFLVEFLFFSFINFTSDFSAIRKIILITNYLRSNLHYFHFLIFYQSRNSHHFLDWKFTEKL